MGQAIQVRTYDPAASVVFLKTKEQFGGLSNMAPGFPLEVNGIRIRTSEALYQACRFPHRPDVQHQIICERSPMTAKMQTKPLRGQSRPDWNSVRVKIMRWCLRVKLAQNWHEFSQLLLSTGYQPIVERSRKDDFWGAKATEDGTLVGKNILGRLLMELREELKTNPPESLQVVEPLPIPEFLLLERPIEPLGSREGVSRSMEFESRHPRPIAEPKLPDSMQPALFDPPMAAQAQGDTKKSIAKIPEPYLSYRDSGLPWLGSVPEHWAVRQLGQFGTFSKGKGGNKEDEVPTGIPCVRYGDLYTTHENFIQKSRSYISTATAENYAPIEYGDVLFAASGETIDEIGKSAVNLIQSKACCGGDVILFRPNQEIEARFLGYATNCMPAATQKASMGRGITVIHIYADRLKHLSLGVPPLLEQTAIVRFLDHADRRIRRYIRAKEKLIALLEEQRQAIIHQAVTGQTDVRTGLPYSAYKDSGVEWLGNVPEHWAMRRNGQIFVQRNETGFPGLPILEVSLRTGIRIRDFENSNRKQVISNRSMYKRAVKGDIAYNMMRMWQGAAGVAPVDGLVSPAYVVAKPLAGTDTRYFGALFRTSAYMAEVDKYSRGIVKDRNRLYWEDFKRMPSPCPPPEEQAVIAGGIAHITGHIDHGVSGIERQIEALREYRTRLIADVVTGKLDVRAAAAALSGSNPGGAHPSASEDSAPRDAATALS